MKKYKTKEFRASDLIEWGIPWGDPPPDGAVISRSMMTRGRWAVYYDVTFQTKDQIGTNSAYVVSVATPATECQEIEPFHGQETVDAVLVVKTEKMVVSWEPVAHTEET